MSTTTNLLVVNKELLHTYIHTHILTDGSETNVEQQGQTVTYGILGVWWSEQTLGKELHYRALDHHTYYLSPAHVREYMGCQSI